MCNNLTIENEEKRLIDVTQQPPKFSSSFYTDLNRETKLIREAFNSNNFTQLRDLPNFKRQAIIDNSKQKVFDVLDGVQPLFKVQGINAYFTIFKYSPTEYDFAKQIAKIKSIIDTCKQQQISDKPFHSIGTTAKKLKYEDQFFEKEHLIPFHLPDDVFNVKQQSLTRQKIISECARLAGSFKPAGIHKKPIDTLEIISQLKKVIINDYPQSKFTITTNELDIIVLQFFIDGNTKELIYYMSALLNDDRISEYQLCKINNEWGLILNQTILSFSMKPLWAH